MKTLILAFMLLDVSSTIDADRYRGDEVAVGQREQSFRDFYLAAPAS